LQSSALSSKICQSENSVTSYLLRPLTLLKYYYHLCYPETERKSSEKRFPKWADPTVGKNKKCSQLKRGEVRNKDKRLELEPLHFKTVLSLAITRPRQVAEE